MNAPRPLCILRSRAGGFTLLEVILAVSIGLVLALAVYQALTLNYASMESGRERAGRAQLVRGVVGQIQYDMRNVFSGWRPVSKDSSASSSEAEDPIADEDSATPTTTTTDTSTISEYEVPAGGFLGFKDAITLVVRRATVGLDFSPAYQSGPDAPPKADLKLVRYWYGSPGIDSSDTRVGLVRQEIDYIPDVTAGDDPSASARTEIVADEVQSLSVRYFDGSSWLEEWGQTAERSPMAVEIVLGVLPRGVRPEDQARLQAPLEYLRLVVATSDVQPSDDSGPASETDSTSDDSSTSEEGDDSAPAPTEGDAEGQAPPLDSIVPPSDSVLPPSVTAPSGPGGAP